MGETLNSTDSSHTRRSNPEWFLLGDLELPVGTNLDGTLHAWLTELLGPLALHPDFMDRILKSAQDSAEHALQDETVLLYDHIHLMIHVPMEHGSKSGTWGFFHVEKTGHGGEESSAAVHSIEFYLYKEGHEKTV